MSSFWDAAAPTRARNRKTVRGPPVRIQPFTILGAVLCLWVLYAKYRNRPKDQPKSTIRQKTKLAKMLIGALLALMAITYSMRGLGDSLDGKPHEPTLGERVITYFAR
jgi:hypothetical protein